MVARCVPPASSTSVTLTSPIDLPEPSRTVPRTPPKYDWHHAAPVNKTAQNIVFTVIYVSPLFHPLTNPLQPLPDGRGSDRSRDHERAVLIRTCTSVRRSSS